MNTLRRLAPVLLAGPLAGLAIYALLRAIAPASARETDDEWAAWFRSHRLVARLIARSTQPAKDFAIIETPGADGEIRNLRNEFRDPDLAATELRTIEIEFAPDRYRAQVVTFPTAELGARIFESEKRHKVRWTSPRSMHHVVLRIGRHAVIVTPIRDPMNRPVLPPAELTDRIVEAFEERARALQD